MKDFFGDRISDIYETQKTGKLTATYGSGQIRTDNMQVPKGLYVLMATIKSDQGAGNKLTDGIFQVRIHTTSTGVPIAENSHLGNVGYELTYSITAIAEFIENTSLYALGQTSTGANVNGGMKVVLKAMKIG